MSINATQPNSINDSKDRVFNHEQNIDDFQFSKAVAHVFDDMVNRSVPYYKEIQRMVEELAVSFAVPGTSLYDLGCATGRSLSILDKKLPESIQFVGIDASEDMLSRCRERLLSAKPNRKVQLNASDLSEAFSPSNASIVLMILTLQFIRPLRRDALLRSISDGLLENGCLLLVEKVLAEDSLLNRHFINLYYDLKKRNGYSELEISQKREALENVLVPYKLEENKEMLHRAGFRYVDVFFKWYNFCGIIAVK